MGQRNGLSLQVFAYYLQNIAETVQKIQNKHNIIEHNTQENDLYRGQEKLKPNGERNMDVQKKKDICTNDCIFFKEVL